MSQSITGQGGHLFFPSTQKHNLVEDIEILLPVKVRWIPFCGFGGEFENVSSQSEARAAILFFQSARKTQNLVEDVKILLLVKSNWILFRGEVENVSANQRPSRPSCFSDRCEKHLVEDIEIFFPVKFRWILWSSFRGEVENVSTNQRPRRPSCFFFWSGRKHKLGRGC